MVGCPIGCALPLAFFNRIGGDYIYPDIVNVKFQIGMLSVPIDSLCANSLPNLRKDLLCPLPPIHCGRKACKDIQVGLAAQPSVPGKGSLNGDASSVSCFVQYILNLNFESLRKLRHSFPFSHAGYDLLCNLVQDSLNGIRHQPAPRSESVFESGPMN